MQFETQKTIALKNSRYNTAKSSDLIELLHHAIKMQLSIDYRTVKRIFDFYISLYWSRAREPLDYSRESVLLLQGDSAKSTILVCIHYRVEQDYGRQLEPLW